MAVTDRSRPLARTTRAARIRAREAAFAKPFLLRETGPEPLVVPEPAERPDRDPRPHRADTGRSRIPPEALAIAAILAATITNALLALFTF